MPYVPPWLNVTPELFLQASEAGAKTGAQLAALATREQVAQQQAEAAQASAGMRAQAAEQIAAARSEAAQAEAAGRLREADQKQQALENYRALLEENRQRDDLRAADKLTLEQQAGELAKTREAFQEQSAKDKAAAPKLLHSGSDVLLYNPQDQSADLLYKGRGSGAMNKLQEALGLSGQGPAPAGPSAAAPTAAPTGQFQEGQRVRSKSTGRTGTIINGQVQWDEAPAPPAGPQPVSIYQGLPGAQPTPGGGSMYAGANLPVLSDIGAQ